jgi:hypothetical protein
MEKAIISKCKWGGVQFLAGSYSISWHKPRENRCWMVIPFGAAKYLRLSTSKMNCMLISEYKDKSKKTDHSSYRTTLADYLADTENDNRYS